MNYIIFEYKFSFYVAFLTIFINVFLGMKIHFEINFGKNTPGGLLRKAFLLVSYFHIHFSKQKECLYE